MLMPLSFWALGFRGILAPRELLPPVLHFSQNLAEVRPSSGPGITVAVRSEFKLGHWIIYVPFPGLRSDLRPHYPEFLCGLSSSLSSVAGPQGAAALPFVRRVTARMFGEPSPNAGCDCAPLSPSVTGSLCFVDGVIYFVT